MQIGSRFNPFRIFDGSFIPEGISRYKGISPGAKLVWGRFCRYGGTRGAIFPSISTLAEEVGLGAAQTRRYVHELIEARFVEFEEHPGSARTYHFLWHSAFEGEAGDPRHGGFDFGDATPLPYTGVVGDSGTTAVYGSTTLPDTGDPPLLHTGAERESCEGSHLQGSVPPIIPQAENNEYETPQGSEKQDGWEIQTGGSDTNGGSFEAESPRERERTDDATLKRMQSIWRRLSGDRKFNIRTRENEVVAKRTVALSRKCGEDPFTANMETYLKEASKPTYKKFLDSLGEYRKEHPQAEAKADRHAIAEPVVVAVDPLIQPASPNAQIPIPGLPALVQLWNDRVTNGARVEIWVPGSKSHTQLLANAKNPDFKANQDVFFERCNVLALCAKTHKLGLQFDFAFAMKNWAGVLNGEYNWLQGGEASKKKLAVDSLLAKLHKGIAERKAAEQQHAS